MPENQREIEVSQKAWRLSAALILLAGAILRLYDLDLVPFHHDEGVNGNFVKTLLREGVYRYDPENYHGPTLFFFSTIIPWISKFLLGSAGAETYGLTTFAMRLIPAVFGIATIALLLSLRRRIGSLATLAAGAFVAVSPGAVYLSRYFIHETLMVFFVLGTVLATLKFLETTRTGYLLLSAVLAALVFSTKETAIISAAVLLIAVLLTLLFVRFLSQREGRPNQNDETDDSVNSRTVVSLVDRIGGPSSLAILLLAAVSVFVIVNIVFYSSFFTNYPGVYDALRTFKVWSRTGTQVHVHPWYTYVVWLFRAETALLFLGTMGTCLALWRRNSFVVFTSLWTFGTLAAYSLIPYKTPWLLLNFVVPLAIPSGYTIQETYRGLRTSNRTLIAAALAIIFIGISTYQMVMLNFVHYDDASYVYVYVHTYRDIFSLLDKINETANIAGTGQDTHITIVSPEYWPLPWYLRRYKQVSYFGKIVPTTDPLIVGSSDQLFSLQAFLGEHYKLVRSGLNPFGTYPLRPRVDLVLFVRDDLRKP